jgi:hypothetical protein
LWLTPPTIIAPTISAGGRTVTMPAFPAGRYGRRRSGRKAPRWVVPALALLMAAVCALIIWRLYSTFLDGRVHYQLIRYDSVTDQQVRVTFEVVRPGGEAARCVVRARARDGSEVGREEVAVPPGRRGERSVVVTHVLKTTARPVTGEVAGCGKPR